jgi:hypothetical protein
VTVDELCKLKTIETEIKQLQLQLVRVEPQWVQDFVTGSDVNYPYCARQIKISGYDNEVYEQKVKRITNRIKCKIDELMEEKDKLTEYIFSIKNDLIRQILTLRHINGMTFDQIGSELGYEQSTVRKKYNEWFSKNITA